MRDPERDELMAQLAAQAHRDGWNDFQIALAWQTQMPQPPHDDELEEPIARQQAFLDGVAVGRALG